MTKEERLAYQRQYRTIRGYDKKYEKTPKGFLMRLYRNMKSRIEGVQVAKYHLYEGKELFDKESFYSWAEDHPDFKKLYQEYMDAGCPRKLAPSVDRKDSSKGYLFDNIEWVTHSENSRRGTISRHYKNEDRCYS